MRKKVLIITPRSPFQGRGADEQDRLAGIKWFLENGYDVRVVTKYMEGDKLHMDKARHELGLRIDGVPYKFRGRKDLLKRLLNPLYWDGAAYEYFDPEIQDKIKELIREFAPDYVWFDYTYLWPLYKFAKHEKVPIITRSINFEPAHFLDEDGRNVINYIRVLPKLYSEWRASTDSGVVLAITPRERRVYQKFGARVETLPLRGLASKLGRVGSQSRKTGKIRLGFTASTYNVNHNLNALLFLLEDVLPLVKTDYEFYFTGAKLPDSIRARLSAKDLYVGFTESIEKFWEEIDIAVVPSLFGCGMQQKVFEPLAFGIPTITSQRAIAGYPFVENVHFLSAEGSVDFAACIDELASDVEKRMFLGGHSSKLSKELFSTDAISGIMIRSLGSLQKNEK